MELTQANARKAALYGASVVVAAVVPALVRSLLGRPSRAFGNPENGSPVESNSTSSLESEAIVTSSHQGYGKGIFVAAVVGAAVGTAVALLLAPQSGKASREWLAGRTRSLGDRVGVTLEQIKEVVPNGVIPS